MVFSFLFVLVTFTLSDSLRFLIIWSIYAAWHGYFKLTCVSAYRSFLRSPRTLTEPDIFENLELDVIIRSSSLLVHSVIAWGTLWPLCLVRALFAASSKREKLSWRNNSS